MDLSDIISRLSIIIDAIEYDEMNLSEVYDSLVSLNNDIEESFDHTSDFSFDDLD